MAIFEQINVTEKCVALVATRRKKRVDLHVSVKHI
jgi:hypothetical protein